MTKCSVECHKEPVELSDAWREEILRRCRAIDAGTVELLDAEEVFARIYASLDDGTDEQEQV